MRRKGLSRERVRDVLAQIDGGCMLSDLPPGEEWVVNYLTKRNTLTMTRVGSDWWIQPNENPTPRRRTERTPLPDDPPF
jgi:hypothetical protein